MVTRKPLVIVAGQVQQLGSDEGLSQFAIEAEEDLIAGMPVNVTDFLTARKAKADDAVTYRVLGLVAEDVDDGDFAQLITHGPLVLSDWTAVVGNPFLIPGQQYWLSDTDAGEITTFTIGTGFIVPIGFSLDFFTLDVRLGSAIQLR